MRGRTWLPIGVATSLFGVVALAVYLAGGALDTTLRFRVVDAVSGAWVWDATISLQDRLMRTFYQSDQGAVDLEFTHLKPGRSELSISAPAYEPARIPVSLRRGKNVLREPVRMHGLEIPALSHFVVVDKRDQGRLLLELRPVGRDGKAVLNHPCLDIWVGALVSAQVTQGRYVERPEDRGSERGETLFAGPLVWSWDPRPETTFRYTLEVPLERVKPTSAPYWVIDTLVVVPSPGGASRNEIDDAMARVFELLPDLAAVQRYLDGFQDRFRYYLPPALWNVRGAQ